VVEEDEDEGEVMRTLFKEGGAASSVNKSDNDKGDEQSPLLPPGWVSALDPSSGRTYYYNQSTRITSWTLPDPIKTHCVDWLRVDRIGKPSHFYNTKTGQTRDDLPEPPAEPVGLLTPANKEGELLTNTSPQVVAVPAFASLEAAQRHYQSDTTSDRKNAASLLWNPPLFTGVHQSLRYISYQNSLTTKLDSFNEMKFECIT